MQIDKWYHLYGRKDNIVLEEVPKPESERKTGKWIYYPKASGSVTSTAVHLYPVCSECCCEHPATHYCPNCGARMGDGE